MEDAPQHLNCAINEAMMDPSSSSLGSESKRQEGMLKENGQDGCVVWFSVFGGIFVHGGTSWSAKV